MTSWPQFVQIKISRVDNFINTLMLIGLWGGCNKCCTGAPAVATDLYNHLRRFIGYKHCYFTVDFLTKLITAVVRIPKESVNNLRNFCNFETSADNTISAFFYLSFRLLQSILSMTSK